MKKQSKKIHWKDFEEICQAQSPLTEVAANYGRTIEQMNEIVQREKGMTFEQYWTQQNRIGRQRIYDALPPRRKKRYQNPADETT